MNAWIWGFLVLVLMTLSAHAQSSTYPPKNMPSGTYPSPNVIQPATSTAMDNGCGGQSEDVEEEDTEDDAKKNDKSKSASSAKVAPRNSVQPRLKVSARDCIRPRP